MRGVSFQTGVEFKVNVEGESWAQGDLISGLLEVKNHSYPGGSVPAASILLGLAYAQDRKVKAKDPDSFPDIEMAALTLAHPLAVGEAASSRFKFQLPLNSRVTEKTAAQYLAYGLDSTKPLANLRLNIIPHLHLRDFIDVVSTTFRFVVKTIRSSKKGETKVTLAPPTARELGMVEELDLILTLSETSVEAEYCFTLKQVDARSPGLKTKRIDHALSESFELKGLLHSFNSRLNREVVERSFEQVLTQVKAVPLG